MELIAEGPDEPVLAPAASPSTQSTVPHIISNYGLRIADVEVGGLTFSADLHVAFSLRKTMRALLGGKRGELQLPGGHKVVFDEDKHCIANDAGQPDAGRLRDLLLRVDEPKTERKGTPASRKRGRAGQ